GLFAGGHVGVVAGGGGDGGHHGSRVGCERVERLGEVEYLGRIDAQRPGEGRAVAAVGAGRWNGRGHRRLRPRIARPALHAASPAVRATVTSRERATAAATSPDPGSRPSPSVGRWSTTPR